jgi:hypothetical protein
VSHLGCYVVKTINGCLRSTLEVEVKRWQMQRRGGWLRPWCAFGDRRWCEHRLIRHVCRGTVARRDDLLF